MRSWPLRALTHIRESEARVAMFDARNAAFRAGEMESAAAEVEAFERELRREAAGGGVPKLDELAMTSARRAGAYQKSRVLGAEAARSMAKARAARAQAGGASVLASAARARADALERGEARWMVAARSARDAVRETEAEECWNATRSSSRREQGTD
jgi:hypothetical protein